MASGHSSTAGWRLMLSMVGFWGKLLLSGRIISFVVERVFVGELWVVQLTINCVLLLFPLPGRTRRAES